MHARSLGNMRTAAHTSKGVTGCTSLVSSRCFSFEATGGSRSGASSRSMFWRHAKSLVMLASWQE